MDRHDAFVGPFDPHDGAGVDHFDDGGQQRRNDGDGRKNRDGRGARRRVGDLHDLVTGGDRDRKDFGVQTADRETGQPGAGDATGRAHVRGRVHVAHDLREASGQCGPQLSRPMIGFGNIGYRLSTERIHRLVDAQGQQRTGDECANDESGPRVVARGHLGAGDVCDPQADAGGESDAEYRADGKCE